jgi:hypothetical protein
VQTIEPDQHNPRLWDVANSKMIYIHLIDAAKFTSLTGETVPPSPIVAAPSGRDTDSQNANQDTGVGEYDTNGCYLDEGNVMILDVDDTLPAL